MSKPLFIKGLPVVGAFHQVGVDWNKVTEGVRVNLIPEPENDADLFAVAAYAYGCRIGYLPREQAQVFSPLLIAKAIQVRAQICTIADWVEFRRHQPILLTCEVEKLVPTS